MSHEIVLAEMNKRMYDTQAFSSTSSKLQSKHDISFFFSKSGSLFNPMAGSWAQDSTCLLDQRASHRQTSPRTQGS